MLTLSDPGLHGPPTAHPRRAGLLHIFAGRSSTIARRRRDPNATSHGIDFRAALKGYDKRQEWLFGDYEGRSFRLPPKALAAQVIERLVDAFDGDDFHAVDTLSGLVCRRDDRAMKSQLCGFSQSLLTALYGPDFTRQAYFTKHKRFTI